MTLIILHCQELSVYSVMPCAGGKWSCQAQTLLMSNGEGAEEWRVPMRRPIRLVRAHTGRYNLTMTLQLTDQAAKHAGAKEIQQQSALACYHWLLVEDGKHIS